MSLSADTITTKDGKKYEGEITEDNADSYVIKVSLAAGINDYVTVKKDDVQKIRKALPEEIAWEKIKDVKLMPDLADQAWYDEVVVGKFMALEEKYPDAVFIEKVIEQRKALQGEWDVVNQGGIKLNGKLYTMKEDKFNKYRKRGSYKAAMREYEKMGVDFPHSKAYHESHELAVSTLKRYKSSLEKTLASNEVRKMQEMKVLENLEADRKASIMAAQEERVNLIAKRQEKEKKTLNTMWITVDAKNAKDVENTIKLIDKQIKEIEKQGQMVDKQIDGGEIYQMVVKHIAEEDFKQSGEKLEQLVSAKFNQKYYDVLKEKHDRLFKIKKDADRVKQRAISRGSQSEEDEQ